ncbi:ATP-dependent DNA ligase [Streptomyces sp. NPDC127033]|uniref:ATP-dependent DNA ligase n=1 Tax=Streptomyces sp. NPDC127033 TaxID=3347110 RepID=UPI0036523256
MSTWSLPRPMLAVPVADPALPPDWAAESMWDGYRSLIGRWADGRVVVGSRTGGDLTAAFPDIAAAAVRQLPGDIVLDGELVVWENGRPAFERLRQRAHRTAVSAARAAQQRPAHFVAFDLLRQGDDDLTARPYRSRRKALERLFADRDLQPPWTLCPSTTDPREATGWLQWSAAGMEGLVFKRLDQHYVPNGRGWLKYRMRHTTEAVIGAVSGTTSAPVTALLGRFDSDGRLHYAGRTTVLSAPVRHALAAGLRHAESGHPWTGRTFSVAWGSREHLTVRLVEPDVVAEVAVDVSLEPSGRWRHPVRLLRVRTDMAPADVPLFGRPQ